MWSSAPHSRLLRRPVGKRPSSAGKGIGAPAPDASTRNAEIARALDETAEVLEIAGDDPSRNRAYRNAARAVRGLNEQVVDRLARGAALDDLDGVDEYLAVQIAEMAWSGRLDRLEALHAEAPQLAAALAMLPDVGLKRALCLCRQLRPRPKTLADVLAACRAGQVRALPGFGVKREQALRERLAADLGETG